MERLYVKIRGMAFTKDDILIYNIIAYEVPQYATARDIKKYFRKFGKIAEVRWLYNNNGKQPSKTETAQKHSRGAKLTGRSKMSEFEIKYTKPKSAARALRHVVHYFKNHDIRVRASNSFEQPDGQNIFARIKENDFCIREIAPITTLNDDCLEHICKLLSPIEQVNFVLSCPRFTPALALISKVQYKHFDLSVLSDMTYFQMRIFLQIVGPQIKSTSLKVVSWKFSFHPECERNPFLGTVLFNVEKLKVGQSDSDTLWELVENMYLLQELNMYYCKFNDNFFGHISGSKNLRKLTIIGNIAIKCSGIEKLTGLKHLALYECPQSLLHFKETCKTLINLTHLEIGCFKFSGALDTDDYEHIAQYLQQLKTLKIVYENGNCSSLARLPNLTKLSVAIMSFQGTEQFFRYLVEHQTSQVEELALFTFYFDSKVVNLLTKLKRLKALNCLFHTNNQTIEEISVLTDLEKIELHDLSDPTDMGIMHLLENCLKLKCIRFWCESKTEEDKIRKSRQVLERQRKQGARKIGVHFMFKTATLNDIPKHDYSDVLKITDEVYGSDDFDVLVEIVRNGVYNITRI